MVLIEELHEGDAPRVGASRVGASRVGRRLGVGRLFVEGKVALRISALLDEAVVHQIVVMLLDRRPKVALALAVMERVAVGRPGRTRLGRGEEEEEMVR